MDWQQRAILAVILVLPAACSSTEVARVPVLERSGPAFTRLVLDGDLVFWIAGYQPGDVGVVSKAGGTPTALATDTDLSSGLAVDDTNVYFTAGDPPVLKKV